MLFVSHPHQQTETMSSESKLSSNWDSYDEFAHDTVPRHPKTVFSWEAKRDPVNPVSFVNFARLRRSTLTITFPVQRAPEHLRDDTEFMLRQAKMMKPWNFTLRDASDRLRHDKDFVLTSIRANGNAVKFIPKVMWENPEVAWEAAKLSELTLKHCPSDLLTDRSLVLHALTHHEHGLLFLPKTSPFLDDDELVLAAVTSHGDSLSNVSERLRDNYEIVLAAVKLDGSSLRFASKRLRDNQEIVLAATKSPLSHTNSLFSFQRNNFGTLMRLW